MQELHPIDKAIAAHARWKSHLRQAIETGQSEWTVERMRGPTSFLPVRPLAT